MLKNLKGFEQLDTLGALTIDSDSSFNSFEGLENIARINGDVNITYTTELHDFTGLGNLSSIGGNFIVEYNHSIDSFNGLNTLKIIEGPFTSYWNRIQNFSGMESLEYIGGDVWFGMNYRLSDLSGLETLDSIGGSFLVGSNDSIIDFSGLNGLNKINGDFEIAYNPILTSLAGLDSLNTIEGNISIHNNGNLIDISGLENVDGTLIDDLTITNNGSLSTCNIMSFCTYLEDPQGSVNIHGNDYGCRNPTEVADACGITLPCLPYGNYYFLSQEDINNFSENYPDCIDLMGNVEIQGNDITNLYGLEQIKSINGNLWIVNNNSLAELTGLDNIDSIGGYLKIEKNGLLSDLKGLDNVQKIGNNLYVNFNNNLESLEGIDNIDPASIQYLFIYTNALLSTCEVQSICGRLAISTDSTQIISNASGCRNVNEILEACELVDVSEKDSNNGFVLFPNPAKSEIYIAINNKSIIYEINIYNLLGQNIKHFNSGRRMIDISYLKNGIYIIEVVTNETRMTKKLIIK